MDTLLLSRIQFALTIGFHYIYPPMGMYPNMIYSQPNPEHSLTIYNGSSSARTLKIMLIIAISGVPLVLAYTASIYWIFRGKVRLDSTSY